MSQKVFTLGFNAEAHAHIVAGIRAHEPKFSVTQAGDTSMSAVQMKALIAQSPDMLVINNHSPTIAWEGFNLCRHLREHGYKGPISIVSGARPAGEVTNAATESDTLRDACHARVIQSYAMQDRFSDGAAMRDVVALMRVAAAKQARDKDTGESRVAYMVGPVSVENTLARAVQQYCHTNITLESQRPYFRDRRLNAQALAARAEAMNAYDVIVIESADQLELNPDVRYRHGLTLATSLREHGYKGQILMLTTADAPAEIQQAMRKALDAGVYQMGMDEYVVQRTPHLFCQAVDSLVRQGRDKASAADKGGVKGHIGYVCEDHTTQRALTDMLGKEARRHRHYTTEPLDIRTLKGAMAHDVLIVHMPSDAESAREYDKTIRAMRKAGFEGKILVLDEDHELVGGALPASYSLVVALRRDGIVDEVVSEHELQHAPNRTGDIIAQLAYARMMEKERAEAFKEWGLEGKLAKLMRAEDAWPEKLRLDDNDIQRLRDAVTAFALAKQVVGGGAAPVFSDVAFGKELDVVWDGVHKTLLQGKKNEEGVSRWEGNKPRPMTHEEREKAKKRKAELSDERRNGLPAWERKHGDALYMRANDKQYAMSETEAVFPYILQAGKGALDFSMAAHEAMDAVRESKQPPRNEAEYLDRLRAAFATRVVDMLAAVKRLPEGMEDVSVHRAALEARVVDVMSGHGTMPMRLTPSKDEAALREEEQKEVARNRGLVTVPDMPERWAKLAAQKLGIDVGKGGKPRF